ncbi:C2H2 transcription factor [Ceratocystis lukuohia]|uniref:C2H2 transcription factor n=1 Tax=Ceratocystis lukuohia TaxID=2019550 RepID=A0ABR4MKL0_9PEZI
MDIRDLLSRHEKLVHQNVPPKLLSKSRKTSRASNAASKDKERSPTQYHESFHQQQQPQSQQQQQQQQQTPQQQPQSQSQQQQQQFQAQGSSSVDADTPPVNNQPIQPPLNGSSINLDNRLPPVNFSGYSRGSIHLPPPPFTMANHVSVPTLASNSVISNDANLQMLSDMAASSAPLLPVGEQQSELLPGLDNITPGLHVSFANRARDDDPFSAASFPPAVPSMQMPLEFNLLDEIHLSSAYLAPVFDTTDPITWARVMGSKANSAFPSRVGSPQPDGHDRHPQPQLLSTIDEQHRIPLLRHLTPNDYDSVKAKVQDFNSVLPSDFIFPSRHTLIRYLHGYVLGINDNLPILHLPTLHITLMAPELLLAVAAVGAQYRFEPHRSYSLWYAAKAVAMEQISRRRSSEVKALLPTSSNYTVNSALPSPKMGVRHMFSSSNQDRPGLMDGHRETFTPNTPDARLETIQAILLLFAVGLWNAKAVLNESTSLQSTLAMLLREDGLGPDPEIESDCNWETWVRREKAIRTKIIAFCYFNLSSIAYDDPPNILFSELFLSLPQSGKIWRAENEWSWQQARRTEPRVDMTLQDAFAYILGKGTTGEILQVTTLGLYILAHALMQQIWLLKQSAIRGSSKFDASRSLKLDDVDEITSAIRTWEVAFNQRQRVRAAENGTYNFEDSNHPATQIAHNATALVRLAGIKLYTDSHSGKALATRDPNALAKALSNFQVQSRSFQPLARNERMNRAVFHALHSLTLLIKTGVSFVSQSSNSEWSIQHLLCNFESATLLARWLTTIGMTSSQKMPTKDESILVEMIRQVVGETDHAGPIDPSLSTDDTIRKLAAPIDPLDQPTVRRLAQTVLQIWSRTFRAPHIFEVVNVMADALDAYAACLENPSSLFQQMPAPMLRPMDLIS